ncbi:MAG: rhomboid family intramembrane serine protease [Gemmataceae bacterium]
MGIYDRDYYRRDGPGFLGSLEGRVTGWLIGLNVACFLLQLLTRSRVGAFWYEPFTDALILSVPKVLDGQVWRLLSYAFLHDPGSIWHILFNMLVLYWFGRQVEEAVGSREYLTFYLVAAVLGGLGFVAAYQLKLQPSGQALGASGAVTAALVLAACYNPRQVVYLFFLIPVPIWGVVVLSVAVDAFSLLGQSQGRVATSAHLAGAAFGFCYYRFRWRLTGWLRLPTLPRRRARPNLKLYREDDEAETPTPQTPARPDEEHLEAQVDAILEKIQRVGMEGLTDQERQLLLRASEAIKRRRG